MKVEIIFITPDIAKEMLTHNINNRPVSRSTVAQYKSEMERGLWMETGSSIQFADDGRLIDGQHRLLALVEANKSFNFVVVGSVDKLAFKHIDKNKQRRISENMATDSRINGYESKNFNALASSIKLAWNLSRGHSTSRSGTGSLQITSSESISEYLAHKDIYDKATSMAMRCYQKLNFMTRQEVGGIYAFLVIYKMHDESKVREFFTELFFGHEVLITTLLRDRLIKDRISKSGRMTKGFRMALIAKAWNAFIADRKLKTLSYNEEKEGKIKFN